MKFPLRPLALVALLAGSLVAPAIADPHKDESGHGHGKRHGKREHKEEYWDGRCKVERKWEKNGEYKEERKCKERSARPRQYDGAYHAAPPPSEHPTVVIQPQIVIRP
ncbi:hypothetical protein [Variovorax sp. EBFNA2]|uniref:hypothetical protein n=1 Tax=Variovorax sp. EBFNA2 TaxID=3342097 RepID=UPI0029C0D939|nr:hypothetical protein [Variovorax boronicumulans]WPG40983.1 hypothetical protein RZE79_33335 [Variovorax boronicumulans]